MSLAPETPAPKWIQHGIPATVLAPMEGVTDYAMRAFLTERGGLSFCVSEFLRIIDQLYPARVFFDHVPELKTQCRTRSGTPIQVQLLGGNPEALAKNAIRAVELGAKAIDLNFGCPSPTVNRHDGGATLLKYPARIQAIVREVRDALPSQIPVSAKLRLGWENCEDIRINAEQAALGGASWITIHARTKVQGYAPPAHWQYIAEVRKDLGRIPIVANGDIWTFEDFLRCRELTGCEHFMLGRGILADPYLVGRIAQELGIGSSAPDSDSWRDLVERFSQVTSAESKGESYTVCRVKQWLRYAHLRRPMASFDFIKRATSVSEILTHMAGV